MIILIVKTSALGDIVQSFDVLEYIKEKYPNAKIDWVVSSKAKELVSSHPLVNQTFIFDIKKNSFFTFCKFLKKLRKTSYDVVFDLQGNSKSGLITLFSKSKVKVGFSYKNVSEWPNLISTNFQYEVLKNTNIREQNLKLAQSYFLDPKPYFPKKRLLNINQKEKKQIAKILSQKFKPDAVKILICPSSKWKNKELHFDTLFKFLSLIDKNINCEFLLLWGNEKEKKVAIKFNKNLPHSIILEKLSLPQLQNLISHLDLVIAMDSLPLHLTGSVDVPSFSFFGPTQANVYKPTGSNHFSFQGKCPFNITFTKRCPKLRSCLTNNCINNINSDYIFNIFIKWWNSL